MSGAPAASSLVEVEGLCVAFGARRVVRDVSFRLARGATLALVGESGSGKSLSALSLLGLLPAGAAATGRVRIAGEDVIGAAPETLRRLRGGIAGMVFQEPMNSLNPLARIGAQVIEAIQLHPRPSGALSASAARARAVELLGEVGFPDGAQRLDAFPHQLSGGQRQRVMIAMALANDPALLIADEPTTALDVTIQAQIIDLLMELSAKQGTALLFITHDLGVIAETCTRMITMYAGQVVEDAPVDSALVRPRHPYTSGLLRSLPRLSARGAVLPSIAGRVPTLRDMPTGCRFAERCVHRQEPCAAPQVIEPAGGHLVRCWSHGELVLPGALTDGEAAA